MGDAAAVVTGRGELVLCLCCDRVVTVLFCDCAACNRAVAVDVGRLDRSTFHLLQPDPHDPTVLDARIAIGSLHLDLDFYLELKPTSEHGQAAQAGKGATVDAAGSGRTRTTTDEAAEARRRRGGGGGGGGAALGAVVQWGHFSGTIRNVTLAMSTQVTFDYDKAVTV